VTLRLCCSRTTSKLQLKVRDLEARLPLTATKETPRKRLMWWGVVKVGSRSGLCKPVANPPSALEHEV